MRSLILRGAAVVCVVVGCYLGVDGSVLGALGCGLVGTAFLLRDRRLFPKPGAAAKDNGDTVPLEWGSEYARVR